MTGSLGNHMTEKRLSDQSQVSDQVESFVPAALVLEAKPFRIPDRFPIGTERILERSAANQSHVSHLIQFMRESESAGRRDFRSVALGRDFQIERLAADQRMVEEYIAGQKKPIGGKNGDALRSSFDCNRSPDP